MNHGQLLDLFHLEGCVTQKHAEEILALLKKYTRVEPCKFCNPK
jgi:hypothetical protein